MSNTVILLVCLLSVVCGSPARFDKYQVIRINVETKKHAAVIEELRQDVELDVWSEGMRTLDVMVPPHKMQQLELKLAELSWTTIIPDVQQNIDGVELHQGPREVYNYSDFNSYEDTQRELRVLADACANHPVFRDLTCVIDDLLPNTYHGRTIQVLRVRRPGLDRKIVYLDSLIHAREWLAGTTLMNIANDIVHGLTQDGIDQLEKYDFYFNPIVNPDGYTYTWTGNRMWRKNAAPTYNENCTGTDLNRNFAYDWGVTPGSDGDACGTTYRGESPASEAETQAVQQEIMMYADQIITYISIHCYSQLWLTAYGALISEDPDVCKYPSRYEDCQHPVSQFASLVSGNTYGTEWEGGSTCSTIYPATGITPDYATGVADITFAFTPELRGVDNDGYEYGFVAPASEIPFAYLETWNGVLGVLIKIEDQLQSGACTI